MVASAREHAKTGRALRQRPSVKDVKRVTPLDRWGRRRVSWKRERQAGMRE